MLHILEHSYFTNVFQYFKFLQNFFGMAFELELLEDEGLVSLDKDLTYLVTVKDKIILTDTMKVYQSTKLYYLICWVL